MTGIEPALSAWELFELMGVCAWFSASFAATSGLECPLDACRNGTLMARSRMKVHRGASRPVNREGRQIGRWHAVLVPVSPTGEV